MIFLLVFLSQNMNFPGNCQTESVVQSVFTLQPSMHALVLFTSSSFQQKQNCCSCRLFFQLFFYRNVPKIYISLFEHNQKRVYLQPASIGKACYLSTAYRTNIYVIHMKSFRRSENFQQYTLIYILYKLWIMLLILNTFILRK